jgi:NhaP-type Na+/H+ or K+/H+ antiporter
MIFTWWFIVVGAVFLLMALSSSLLARLPLSTAMLYLGAGILIGPHALGLITIDPIHHAEIIERVTEVAVIISLFSAGLKLQVPRRDPFRRLPVLLASWSMVLTVALITLVGTLALDLPLGAAVLLGAVLAPTDPVLASDVQVTGPRDRDRLRFTLTGEAGLNDGTAFLRRARPGAPWLGGAWHVRVALVRRRCAVGGCGRAAHRGAVGDRGRASHPLSAPRSSGDGWLR